MNYNEFVQAFHRLLPRNSVISNPGGGITTIIDLDTERVIYQRGKAKFRVKFADLYAAYEHFKGKCVSSNDLNQFRPNVFDQKANGHHCNCTFLFQFLLKAKLVESIRGEGKRGSPFWVEISED